MKLLNQVQITVETIYIHFRKVMISSFFLSLSHELIGRVNWLQIKMRETNLGKGHSCIQKFGEGTKKNHSTILPKNNLGNLQFTEK